MIKKWWKGDRIFKKCTVKKSYLIIAMTVMLLAEAISLRFINVRAAESNISLNVEATGNNVEKVKSLANSLYTDNSGNFSSTKGQFTWDTQKNDKSWTYYNGIMMQAYLMINRETYLPSVNAFFDNNLCDDLITRKIDGKDTIYYDQANGVTFGYVNNTSAADNYYRPNELDSIPPARVLFDLLRDTSGTVSYTQKAKYIKMIEYVNEIMQSSKWTVQNSSNQAVAVGGNVRHKYNNDGWSTYQVALDSLYMSQPFFMELAHGLDDGLFNSSNKLKNLNSSMIYDAVCNRMIWIGNNLYDSNTGLYNHGWGPDAGLNGHFWSRATGWYAAALADVITMLPDSYASQRSSLVGIATRLFDGMIDYQDVDTGMWYNVTNRDYTLTDGSGNKLESSGSALMAYAMMKLYDEGYVGEKYGMAGLKAFNGTVKNKVTAQGLIDVYISSGVSTTDEGYLQKDYKVNEAKGVGPLIMAACYANSVAEKLKNSYTNPLVPDNAQEKLETPTNAASAAPKKNW